MNENLLWIIVAFVAYMLMMIIFWAEEDSVDGYQSYPLRHRI